MKQLNQFKLKNQNVEMSLIKFYICYPKDFKDFVKLIPLNCIEDSVMCCGIGREKK